MSIFFNEANKIADQRSVLATSLFIVSPSLKGPLQLYALHGPMFLFVDRLGFIDSGCGIKIVAMFVSSAKNTLTVGAG